MNKVGELERIGEGGELDGMGKEKKEILRAELASQAVSKDQLETKIEGFVVGKGDSNTKFFHIVVLEGGI